MSGAETVNDEFEFGFNQDFESRWYRAEQAGRVVMVLFTLGAGLGFLRRGPFSHATTLSADGALTVNYEPLVRHGIGTMISVHIRKLEPIAHSIELRINQLIIEPMDYQYTVPLADSSSVTDDGIRLTYSEAANQSDVLVRFEVSPNAIGLIPLQVSDGTDTINWSMLSASPSPRCSTTTTAWSERSVPSARLV
jgi:hypothetical protein